MLPIVRYKIKDRSMEPAFKVDDYVIVNKLAYVFQKPAKGDVIVFKHPREKNKFLIKRINGIDGNKFFVVGDNKNHSKDSRHFGAIDRNLIVGKLFIHIKQ